MNKMTKLAAAIALTTGALTAPTIAMADVSATAGFVSDYYFRGANLGDAGAYGAVDYSAGGFYAGLWTIDDGTAGNDGLEVDVYFGYAFEFENGLSLDLGYAAYEYTYVDDSEAEIALTAGFGAFSVSYVDGDDDNPDAADFGYDVITVSWSGDVFGATYGRYDADGAGDNEYDWIEVSASGDVVGLDVTLAVGTQTNVEAGGTSTSSGDGYIFLDVSKSFDL